MSVVTPVNQSQVVISNQYRFYPWVVWGLAAAYFFCDYFARVSPGVMVDELMLTFHVTGLGLGGLSAFFYYPYVAMQVPVGMLVDRYGVRRLIITMSLLTGIACYLFGKAPNLMVAEFARFLLGFGAAFAFVSALKLASVWFSASRFGLLAGLTQALGMIGAVVGEAPVSFSVQNIGWRNTMFVMAAIFMVLTLAIYLFVRDTPPEYKAQGKQIESFSDMWQSLLEVLNNSQSWCNALYAGLLYAPVAAFAELWGVSYLEHVQHFTIGEAATANSMIFLGWGVGGPIMGWLSDRLGVRKPIMLASAVTGFVLLTAIILIPGLSKFAIFSLLFIFGVSNNGVGIAYAVASEINRRPIAGVSMAFANMMSVIVGALLQPVIGWILDYCATDRIVNGIPHYVASDFKTGMIVLPICLLLSIFMVYFIRETNCRPVDANKL